MVMVSLHSNKTLTKNCMDLYSCTEGGNIYVLACVCVFVCVCVCVNMVYVQVHMLVYIEAREH